MTTTDDTRQAERIMRARADKAGKLTLILESHGATHLDARALPPLGRRITETLAGVPEASPATWELVAQFLAARATVPPDPFSVVPPVSS